MNMRKIFGGLTIAVAAVAIQPVQAQPFNLTVGESEATVWRAASEEREQVSGATSINIGDTLFAADEKGSVIRLESNTRILVKGGSVLVLDGQDGAVDIVLDDGQIFLDRGQPRQLSAVRILAGGCTFTPAGTAIAVKTSRGGAPTVAVLRGTVQMQTADGHSVFVGPGKFGTVGGNGKLAAGAINENGIRQLESWSGVRLEGAPSSGSDVHPAGDSHQSTETAASAPDADTAGQADSDSVDADPSAGHGKQKVKKEKAESRYAPAPLFAKPDFEISAGVFTSDGDLWTRFMLGIDIPIWRFGLFLDLELFFDNKFSISDKGWNFKDDPADAIFRKIRYIRYGQEDDPLFVKFGGLSSVTMGYGIVMDGFSNMLHYPDEKLLGLQVNLNDVSPLGISMQTLISDFDELFDDGGVVAARLAFRPLKTTGLPLLNGLFIGGTYATDINTQAPARKWPRANDTTAAPRGYEPLEGSIRNSTNPFSVYGFDAGIPIINWDLLNVVLYSQIANRADNVRGWSYGIPGVAVNVWKLWANVEYRRIEGRYAPGFFDRYYLDERYSRDYMKEKGEYIDSVSLSGVYGRAGMDVWDLLKVEASYQYMLVKKSDDRIQSYEGTVGLGETVLTFIPKISLAEAYIRNSNIGNALNIKFNDKGEEKPEKLAGPFDRSPYMYWGGRVGFDIFAGLTLICDYRHGWEINGGKLESDNRIFLHTALRF